MNMVPFVGPSYRLKTRKADVQRTVNMYPVWNEAAGGKTGSYLESIPGVALFSTGASAACDLGAPPARSASPGSLFLDNLTGTVDGAPISAHTPAIGLAWTVFEAMELPTAINRWAVSNSEVLAGAATETELQSGSEFSLGLTVGIFGEVSGFCEYKLASDVYSNSAMLAIYGYQAMAVWSSEGSYQSSEFTIPPCEYVYLRLLSETTVDGTRLTFYANGTEVSSQEFGEQMPSDGSLANLTLKMSNDVSSGFRVGGFEYIAPEA